MPDPNAVIDSVADLVPESGPMATQQASSTRFLRVQLSGGRAGLLDTTDPRSTGWTQVLRAVGRTGDPVYIVLDPASAVITQLLLPVPYGVESITPTADGSGVDVALVISHARHRVSRTNPDFARIVGLLERARDQGTSVLVTESPDDHEIVDVRPAPSTFAPLPAEPPPRAEALPIAAPVSLAQAQQLFNLVSAQSCCPGTASAPCIPFLYPDDGCWGRAHEMCRLMISAGAQPEKVWIYGQLRVSTANHPSCQVQWNWHVAPTVQVGSGSSAQTYVIDPSLFNGPVSRATWAGVQGDPAATLVASSAAVFHRSFNGSVIYDPTYSQTNSVLATYRNQLVLRTASGAPPYATCMTRGPGVQWIGSIGANATQRWFTHSWPAAWHVIWTIMPLTPCRGAPQLTWTTQVERASATHATYWITVRNMTASPVTFEGRFDVLSRAGMSALGEAASIIERRTAHHEDRSTVDRIARSGRDATMVHP